MAFFECSAKSPVDAASHEKEGERKKKRLKEKGKKEKRELLFFF